DASGTPAANATGVPLASLVTQLQASNKQAVVLRADPEYTDAAQLATVGLYGIGGAADVTDAGVRALEQQTALLSPAPRSSSELMCALASGPAGLEDRAAVVVPEQVMAQFNDAKAPLHEPECLTGRLGQRAPEYPSDVGMLDLPFVHVTWRGGDRDAAARNAAVEALHGWLTGADGQKVFTDAGYRALSDHAGDAAAPPAGSWLTGPGRALGQLPHPADAAPAASVERALTEFHSARGPGQVLYLLDSSTSMGDTVNKVWSGPGRAKDLVAQTLDAFGPDDQYGVWTVSGTSPPDHALVPFGSYASPTGPRQRLAAARTGGEAHPGDAVLDALGELKRDQRTGRPQLIVMLTDDEDDTWITPDQLKRIGSAATAQHVPVYWVSLTSAGCTSSSRHLGPEVAGATGGRCLDPGGNQIAGLREAVTGVGTGGAQ
ncbi:vWA domain-containing protein, partial [Actinacidiphila rubida]|uniref:vWA domain-containing protein n=1 Tax=Actinacidiphila rubida TaxID=310780 RepID=UPI00114D0174